MCAFKRTVLNELITFDPQLQAKEVKRDAEELQDQTEFEVGDSMHKMRKVQTFLDHS